jgi:hypothetical protein
VLLCGGEVGSIIETTPKSLRDAFIRAEGHSKVKNFNVLRIEDIQEFFEKDCPYIDLVAFETDIALICELVILFCESPGSFTELGCFSMITEIYEKIIVIIQSHYLSQSTFITKGPVANLKREYPKSVFSIVDRGIGIYNGDVSIVDCEKLVEIVSQPIEDRLKETEGRTTLDLSKFNHLCKIYVGILRELFCLTDDEILLILWELGFEIDKLKLDRVAFCCWALKWTATTTVRFDRIHYAIQSNNEAARFEFRPPFQDKIRRRSEFRQYWENNDPDRLSAVSQDLS